MEWEAVVEVTVSSGLIIIPFRFFTPRDDEKGITTEDPDKNKQQRDEDKPNGRTG
ncbi:MAG: hypothetical protein QF586_00675 [Arenicellales bacterium]|jgi:hypothetical protein|nr:hypothetical protein [Arenicellales bacterium]MDP6288717.1 hypothetical protein [Arenicellales bacterium]MDP7155822.1 hypothetical protein [Arenicellales bacterium]MDP7283838.1 hypothetical protein [Arenicellales bacterium]MDP7482510.1 hypothetical protein [Arenicellales bacterium]|tara:strand:+ start:1337 stop:1501 length:165 start_codon:yes stop_codon:yes gene_type:complete